MEKVIRPLFSDLNSKDEEELEKLKVSHLILPYLLLLVGLFGSCVVFLSEAVRAGEMFKKK